ncbi:MAG: hypothetical protein HOP28_07345 [Gemmatimonadales bacterium]|nr:hypothetical protein [Gemmatimonadales bacterium]
MSNRLHRPIVLTIAALALSAPLAAQGRSAVNEAELDAAVTARPAGNREAMRTMLTTTQARQVAAKMGANTADLLAGLATLDEGSVTFLADRARANERLLAGGAGNIVISTTAVIIGLLILILLVG